MALECHKRAHSNEKLKVLVSFISDKKIGGHLGPLSRSFFPKSPDQNSKIAILFTVVQKFNNYVFRDDLIPQSPRGEELRVTNFDHCLHIVRVIGKYTDVFRGTFSG